MNLGALERLDRRWLFLALGLLVLGPLLWPIGMPVAPSRPSIQS